MKTALRIQKIIAVVSVLIFIGKLAAWYLTQSISILSDALESIVNVVTGFLGLYSLFLSSKPRDRNHPYGHGKAEYISSAVEGILISIAGAVIIGQVIYTLFVPKPIHKVDLGILLSILTGALNLALGAYAVYHGRKGKSIVVESAGAHLKSDAYSTFAIVLGLILIHLTNQFWLDQLIASIFGIIIIVTGYKILRKSLAAIMDEADELLLQQVLDTINAQRPTQWIDLHNLRSIQYGNILHIDAHLSLPWYFTTAQSEAEVLYFEQIIHQSFDYKVECFIHVDACKPFSCAICQLENCLERTQQHSHAIPWTLQNVMLDRQHCI
jgi:cation diffusion facilitator family transporter